jgi:hypothetical protein
MLQKLVILLNKNFQAIPAKHTDLVRSLRTAQAISYKLQKGRMVNCDLLDALSPSLKDLNKIITI